MIRQPRCVNWDFGQSAAVFLVYSTILVGHAFGAETSPPNVLFILADDLGYGDLACYGNPVVETSAIDSLARSGARLTQHYAPSPLCAPSRAGYLTGRFNHRTGAVDVPSNRGLDRIALSELTFGDYFRHAGYRTALIGKWHNGLYCRDYLPHHRGFDLFFGFPNGGQDYWKWNLLRNDIHVPHDGRYLTDAFNDEAIEFVTRCSKGKQPFALFLAHHTPHMPFQAPEPLVEKYRQKLGDASLDNVAIIYAMIEAMDLGLARLFQKLDELGIRDDTIVVFTSDNGAQFGKVDGLTTQRFHAGLSGNKGDVGEQGIRVPAIVSWPGHIPSERVIDTPLHGCDWLPTLFALTGSKLPPKAKPFDGRNVLPILRGESDSQMLEWPLYFQKNRYLPVEHSDAAIRQGKWKLVWPGISSTMRKDSGRDNPSYLRGITNPHWEMPLDRELAEPDESDAPRPKLFNLNVDPAERFDVASQHPEMVHRLSSEYDAWFAEVMYEWQMSRQEILEHDRTYWNDRTSPDPRALFDDYWLWRDAPAGANPQTTDPLKVFRGYWSNEEMSR
ncbi:MAG: sulfatase-like hydrolase/transferase [Planctomycetaceae bacterium]|nr:sulfatase-like hydrolase/transferase [Planctomycetaceae bacterium]